MPCRIDRLCCECGNVELWGNCLAPMPLHVTVGSEAVMWTAYPERFQTGAKQTKIAGKRISHFRSWLSGLSGRSCLLLRRLELAVSGNSGTPHGVDSQGTLI